MLLFTDTTRPPQMFRHNGQTPSGPIFTLSLEPRRFLVAPSSGLQTFKFKCLKRSITVHSLTPCTSCTISALQCIYLFRTANKTSSRSHELTLAYSALFGRHETHVSPLPPHHSQRLQNRPSCFARISSLSGNLQHNTPHK